jgi:hypothetical protein
VNAIGSPGVSRRILIEVGTKVLIIHGAQMVPRNKPLEVEGQLRPRWWSRLKFVQLQYKDGKVWRPVANGYIRKEGRFAFRYRFARAGGFAVMMRVAAPREKGWKFLPSVSRPFKVMVG